jgi:cyanobactin maturation PatA/PatG family protease
MASVAEIEGLKDLWAETTGDPRIRVAILDGPVDQSHPCFAGAKLTILETLVSSTPSHGPATQHGTHVASVIFGQHGSPIAGVAPKCSGLIVPVFEDGKSGELAPCSQIDLARAILQALQHGAEIINVSGGQLTPGGEAHPLLVDAVRTCSSSDVLIVSSVGNDGCECLHIPGALPSVLAVGAMDSHGLPLEFSNWGGQYQSQGILGPGVDILGAKPGGATQLQTGTSSATAIVSGVVALLLSIQLRLRCQVDPSAVRTAILGTAQGCEHQPISDCRRLLVGRLNIQGARGIIRRPEVAAMPVQETGSLTDTLRESDAAPTSGIPANSASGSGSEPVSTVRSDTSDTSAGQSVSPSGVMSSACSCGCASGGPPQLVYALGRLGYDFGTEARRDSIQQHMDAGDSPYNTAHLLKYLKANPWDAEAIIWTLNLDATPIYAIQPARSFASDAYAYLRQALDDQLNPHEGVERISVAGVIAGKVRLFTGQLVPVVRPELRCLYSWKTTKLLEAIAGTAPGKGASPLDLQAYAQKTQPIRNFLERVYFELRNLGLTPQERALNYAGTNAFSIGKIFEASIKDGMELDTIEVETSPICRLDAVCLDVKLFFFHPKEQLVRARKVYRFTIDVSDICPVSVDTIREWSVR